VKPAATLALALALLAPAATAQVTLGGEDARLTVEAWANAAVAPGAPGARADDADWQADGGLRALGIARLPGGGRLGLRAAAEGQAGATDEVELVEQSLLWTGAWGRLEYGERQGLPDVLTGYAPNPFTFTTAEFGPASGLALDPGGGLAQRFVPDAAAGAHDALAVLGYGTSRFGDRSRKLLFVSPKRGGWLAGASWAADADLLQAGLVHETYAGENVLRVGGAWARARGADGERLDSLLAGASLDLAQTWLLGVAATWNPDSSAAPLAGWRSDALGLTASLNWNRGSWTAGGYAQIARGRESAAADTERLRAAEVGLSYRTSTRLRLFVAFYRFRLDGRAEAAADDLLAIAGARITL
jgi:hypothetical protein